MVGPARDVDDDVAGACPLTGVPATLYDDRTVVAGLVDSLAPDCVVVSSYDRILPRDLLARCPFVNVHYAPLPRYRGRANVNWAIINGEETSAATVHSMVPELDTGGVLGRQTVAIGPRDNVTSLYEKLNSALCGLLPDAVARRLAGDLGDPQDEREATYGAPVSPTTG